MRLHLFVISLFNLVSIYMQVLHFRAHHRSQCPCCSLWRRGTNGNMRIPLPSIIMYINSRFLLSILDYWQRVMGWNWVPAPIPMYVKMKNHGQNQHMILLQQSPPQHFGCVDGLWCPCLVQSCIVFKSWVCILCITTVVRLFIKSFCILDYFRAQLQNETILVRLNFGYTHTLCVSSK